MWPPETKSRCTEAGNGSDSLFYMTHYNKGMIDSTGKKQHIGCWPNGTIYTLMQPSMLRDSAQILATNIHSPRYIRTPSPATADVPEHHSHRIVEAGHCSTGHSAGLLTPKFQASSVL